jgi:hypothetical protein
MIHICTVHELDSPLPERHTLKRSLSERNDFRLLSRFTNSADRRDRSNDPSRALMHTSSTKGGPTRPQENEMSRTNTQAVAPMPAVLSSRALRAGLGLAVVAALVSFAVRAEAQERNTPAINLRPVVGALIGTGDMNDALKSAVLVGGQASYAFHQNFAVVGTFGWSPSEDKLSLGQPKVDLYQYDLGIEGRLNDLTEGAAIATRPYAAIGGGGRTYSLRNVPNADAQTNALGYGAVGVDLDRPGGKYGVRLEARDNVTGFKGFRGEFPDRKARNDVQFTAGLTFGF